MVGQRCGSIALPAQAGVVLGEVMPQCGQSFTTLQGIAVSHTSGSACLKHFGTQDYMFAAVLLRLNAAICVE